MINLHPPHPARIGRVQSVALRLIAEREAEREAFKPDEWWTVDPLLTNANGKPFRVSVRSACPSAAACVALCMQHHRLSCKLKTCLPLPTLECCFLQSRTKAFTGVVPHAHVQWAPSHISR